MFFCINMLAVLRQFHPACIILSSKQDDRLVQTLRSLGNNPNKGTDCEYKMTLLKVFVRWKATKLCTK